MPVFAWRAYDAEGKETSGVLDAPDLAEARQRLRTRGLMPFELEPAEGAEAAGPGSSDGLSLADRSRLARQLGALLKGGVPLAKALAGMESQEAWASRRLLIAGIREGIERGRDLSSVLGERPGVFDPWSLSVIRVGEATGRLDQAFGELAVHLSRQMEHRRRFLAAITYPVVMAVVAIGVLTFLLVYLIPMLEKIFADMRGQLPLITQVLIATSRFLRSWGLLCVAGGAVGLVLGRTFLASAAVRREAEGWIRSIPVLGPFFHLLRVEGWARNTAMMVRCGVPLLEAVRVARSCSDSVLEREALDLVEAGLVKGQALSVALKASPEYPAMVLQMVEAGESSGDLAGMLASVAVELEAESASSLELVLNLVEPLLIVGMGVVVGGIMVGVLLPIYEMNRLM